MAFVLAKIDEEMLKQVNIVIDGVNNSITLDENNLMFPPVITKDNKSANFLEVESGAYEPFKFYKNSKSRAITLEFEWVTGSFKKSKAKDLLDTLSDIKGYFYRAFLGSDKKKEYPIVKIIRFYDLIYGTSLGKSSAWRMISVDVKYSKEMIKLESEGTYFFPLHVKLVMNLEMATQLGKPNSNKGAFRSFENLPPSPSPLWF